MTVSIVVICANIFPNKRIDFLDIIYYHCFIREMGFLSGKRLYAERVARFFFYVYNIIQIQLSII